MSYDKENDSKQEMYQKQKDTFVRPQPSTAPPSYEKSIGIYPTIPGTMPGTLPSMPETKLTMPDNNPPFPGTRSYPQAPMEKNGVNRECGNCHNQGMTSVDSSVNKFGIAWIIVSICFFWPFAFFVMCIDCFRTWKHTCSSCGNLLTEFTPKASGGTICGLVCTAIIFISFFLFFLFICFIVYCFFQGGFYSEWSLLISKYCFLQKLKNKKKLQKFLWHFLT